MPKQYSTLIRCKICQQDLTHDQFYWTPWGTLQQGYKCKACWRGRNTRRYQQRKDDLELNPELRQPPAHCNICLQSLPITKFYRNPSYASGYSPYCRSCRSSAYRTGTEAKAWLMSYKATLSCENCGESEPCCLDFHHRDPAQKKDMVSRMAHHKTILEVQNEIDKCSVLCANCHRKLHAGILKSSMG